MTDDPLREELDAMVSEYELAHGFSRSSLKSVALDLLRELRERGWIKCSERMPTPEEWVIAYNGKFKGVAAWHPDAEEDEPRTGWQDEYREFIELDAPRITHWMPLPAAPKEEDEHADLP